MHNKYFYVWYILRLYRLYRLTQGCLKSCWKCWVLSNGLKKIKIITDALHTQKRWISGSLLLVITVGLDFSLNENVSSYLIIFQWFNSDKSRCVLYGTMRPALNCFFSTLISISVLTVSHRLMFLAVINWIILP